jgi:RNA polymerase sigma-70 factor (ECF subfamily)
MIDESPEVEPLLRRLRDGERDALALLFNYYRPRLRQMVRLRMDTRMAARVDPSDVLQEAYLDAARQVQSYLRRPAVAVYVWLRGLTWERLLNLQRDHLGAQRRAVDRELPLPAESSVHLARQLLAQGPSPSQGLLQDELRQRVQQALAALAPTDHEVILMRHFEGMSNREVAQTLGLSDSGATMRYGRALFRLKEILLRGLSAGESRL